MKEHAKALISRGFNSGRVAGVALLSDGLRDEREEMFVILVCDGLPMGLAFRRAGFSSKDHNAPHALMALPRVQERAAAILEARRTTGVVTLPEVTNMLQRVFASAHSAEEYSAAHNAAFSLARLYGHVNDKSTLEIIRRPSRDPDAPSEQMLEDWAASLPVIGESAAETGQKGPPQGPPAALLGPGPHAPMHPSVQLDLFAGLEGSGPAADGPGETGNGAPGRPVTGTPHRSGGSEILEGTGTKMGEIPSFDELFG